MNRETCRLKKCGDVTPTDPPLVLVQQGPGGVVLSPLAEGKTPQEVVQQFRSTRQSLRRYKRKSSKGLTRGDD